jgi:hypothetical protein
VGVRNFGLIGGTESEKGIGGGEGEKLNGGGEGDKWNAGVEGQKSIRGGEADEINGLRYCFGLVGVCTWDLAFAGFIDELLFLVTVDSLASILGVAKKSLALAFLMRKSTLTSTIFDWLDLASFSDFDRVEFSVRYKVLVFITLENV